MVESKPPEKAMGQDMLKSRVMVARGGGLHPAISLTNVDLPGAIAAPNRDLLTFHDLEADAVTARGARGWGV